MSPLQERYLHLRKHIEALAEKSEHRQTVTLVVVSKKRSSAEIQALYDVGCRHFGENRLEEALEKMAALPKDIRWHFIGTIQSKKVPKVVAAGFYLIHSVDSIALAEKLSNKSIQLQCETRVLLQANTSGEESKHGLSDEEWRQHFSEVASLPGLKIEGWMTMAPLTQESEKIHAAFTSLRELGDTLAPTACPMPHLSMGMSHDYPIAIQEGTTYVRLGSIVFEV